MAEKGRGLHHVITLQHGNAGEALVHDVGRVLEDKWAENQTLLGILQDGPKQAAVYLRGDQVMEGVHVPQVAAQQEPLSTPAIGGAADTEQSVVGPRCLWRTDLF